MGLTSEIYLTKKFVSKEDWNQLINTISNYNGFFRRWKFNPPLPVIVSSSHNLNQESEFQA